MCFEVKLHQEFEIKSIVQKHKKNLIVQFCNIHLRGSILHQVSRILICLATVATPMVGVL